MAMVSLVGKVGVEPTCDQLLFLLLIRERRYNPIKSYSITISPNSVQVKAFGKFVLICALDSKSPARKRGIISGMNPLF